MTSDDTLNRFDDVLNGKAEGGDAALSETVRRFYAMDARDREPEPKPDFLRHLQEQLMNHAQTMPTGSIQYPAPSTQHPAPAFRLPSSALRPRRAWPNLAAAAVILLTLGAGLLAYRLAPNGSDEPPTLPAAAQGTPETAATADPNAIDIAECATTARPDGTVVGLIDGTPTTARVLPPLADLHAETDIDTVLADLPDADAVTVAGIEQTVQQLSACRFDAHPRALDSADYLTYPNLDGRYFALYSDDFFRRELYRSDMNAAVVLPGVPTPSDPFGLAVETPRRLPDGRVAAVLAAREGQWPDTAIAVFTKQGDRWLVDEYRWIDGISTASTARSQIVEVLLWDDEGAILDYQNVAGHTLRAGEPVILTVANLGMRPHRLVIGELGIDVELQPGQSRTFRFTPARGTYGVASAVIDESGEVQPVPVLPGELVFVSQEVGTPEASPAAATAPSS